MIHTYVKDRMYLRKRNENWPVSPNHSAELKGLEVTVQIVHRLMKGE